MNTNIIREEMSRLDEITGMDTARVPVRISSRMTRTWGKCCWQRSGENYYIKELVFAKRLIDHGTMEHIINVIRHEYAHLYVTWTYNEIHGHDGVWKRVALWLGCNARRCENFEEIDELDIGIQYKVICQGCGCVFRYRRKSNIVKELECNPNSTMFFCRRCGCHNFVLNAVSKRMNQAVI